MNYKIELKEMGFYYEASEKNSNILSGISIVLESTKIYAFVGPSGCGKSTLLKVLCGILTPTSGERSIHPDRPIRTGYAPQEPCPVPWLSVVANVMLSQRLSPSLNDSQGDDIARELLTRFELSKYELDLPHKLSGGMQQRVSLARAIAHRPDFVFLDEPFSNLDGGLKLRIYNQFFSFVSGFAAGVVFVTHDLREAATLANEVCILSADSSSRIRRIPLNYSLKERLAGDRVSEERIQQNMKMILGGNE